MECQIQRLRGVFVFVSLAVGLLICLRNDRTFDPFFEICRALGFPVMRKFPRIHGAAHASLPASDVAWNLPTERLLSGASVARGAVLAKTVCGGCHGVDGK